MYELVPLARLDWTVVFVVLAVAAAVTLLALVQQSQGRYERALTSKVRDIMSHPVVVVNEDDSLEDAARAMLTRGIGCVPVVDDGGRLTGILTESDFAGARRPLPFSAFGAPQVLGEWIPQEGVEQILAEARRRSVSEVMTRDVVTIGEKDSVTRLVHLMIERELRHVPVVEDRRVVGVVTRRDLLRLMVPHGRSG